MNQAARDILIEAELLGHRQIIEAYWDAHGGHCAIGRLHWEWHKRSSAREQACGDNSPERIDADCARAMYVAYGIADKTTETAIAKDNDAGLTFGQIAAKYGDCPPVEPVVPVAEVVAG